MPVGTRRASTLDGLDSTDFAILLGQAGGQTLIGGTGTTDDLTLQTTSGVGAAGADMHFLVGNNGAIEAMTILNNGNIGINTPVPTSNFEITGTDVISEIVGTATASNPQFRLNASASAGGRVWAIFTSGSAGVLPDKFSIRDITAIEDRLVIDSLGRVGIGNTSPVTILDISAITAVTSVVADMLTIELTSSGTVEAGFGTGIVFKLEDLGGSEEQASIDVVLGVVTDAAEEASIVFRHNVAGTIQESMRIDGTAGNVGIGTANPLAKLAINGGLHVGGDSDPGDNNLLVDGNVIVSLVIGGTSTTADLSFKTTTGVGIASADMHFLVGNNGATEAMTILNNGRVGIGTIAPNAELDVRGLPGASVGGFPSGQLHVTSTSALVNANSVITGHNLFGGNKQLWYLGSVSGSNDNIGFINRQNASLSFSTDSTTRMTIAADGSVLINGDVEMDGALNHDGTTVGFYGTVPIAQQTGVAVTDAAIHAALVSLGLITA